MNRKIVLGGGGDEITAKVPHQFFANLLSDNPKVLYIPIAMDTAIHSWESCNKWIHKALGLVGISQITMLTDLEKVTDEDLSQFDGIFIGGGNTYKLLKLVRESGFDKILVKYLDNGGVVFGGSAGAIIMGKSILGCGDINDVDLKDLAGLNLVGESSVHCHYTDSDKEKVEALSHELNSQIIAIDEASAVYLDGEKIEKIGSGVHFVE